MKQIFVALLLLSGLFTLQLHAQDAHSNKESGQFFSDAINDIEDKLVQNEKGTSIGWDFSKLASLESELIEKGKGDVNLSEMYIIRMAYTDKAEQYVRTQGKSNFCQGGTFQDIPLLIEKYGILPESIYEGLPYENDKHIHKEMETILKGICDVVLNSQGLGTTSWMKAFDAVLDAYLGVVPESFEYNGTSYTPETFAAYLNSNMNAG
jgi:bleomycin hydrolase